MRFLALAGVLTSALSAQAASAATVFTYITDNAVLSADGTPNLTLYNPQLAGNTVVFGARSQNALYSLYAAPAAGGALTSLVTSDTPVPDGTGDFSPSVYGAVPPFQRGGCNVPVAGIATGSASAVFVGNDAAGHQGIYSVPLAGGKVLKIADWKTPIPGGPLPAGDTLFNANYTFCNLTISAATVVFDATGGDGLGVYSVATNGHGLARIADPNTVVANPEPFPAVDLFMQPSLLGKEAVYVGGTTGGPFGIYAGGLTSPGKAIFSEATSEATAFDQFNHPTFAGKTVLFSAAANLAENPNVLATVPITGGTPTIILELGVTPNPSGSRGKSIASIGTDTYNFLGNDGKRLIFSAVTEEAPPNQGITYDGVFSVCNGKLTKLIQTGDLVGTQQLRALGGISNIEAVTINGVAMERFAAWLTLGAVTSPPTIYDGAPAIYTVTVPAC